MAASKAAAASVAHVAETRSAFVTARQANALPRSIHPRVRPFRFEARSTHDGNCFEWVEALLTGTALVAASAAAAAAARVCECSTRFGTALEAQALPRSIHPWVRPYRFEARSTHLRCGFLGVDALATSSTLVAASAAAALAPAAYVIEARSAFVTAR
jgi:hypothetical protein